MNITHEYTVVAMQLPQRPTLLPLEEVDGPFGRTYKKFVVHRGPAIVHGQVEKVKLDQIIATQDYLNPDVLRKYYDKAGDLPIIIRQNSKMYVGDGHHRLEAEKLKGKTEVEALVVDVDERGHPY